ASSSEVFVASSVHQRVALTVLGIVVLSTVTPMATGQAPKQFTRSLPSIPALGASLVEKRNQTPSVLVAGVGERTPAAALVFRRATSCYAWGRMPSQRWS